MESLKKESDEWAAFIEELWEMQWTCIYNELTDELNNKMYELSLGNLDIAHRIYREAQRLVILADSDDERINTSVLEQAYVKSLWFCLLVPMKSKSYKNVFTKKGIEGKKIRRPQCIPDNREFIAGYYSGSASRVQAEFT
ncbi:hypothetical protein ACKU07_23460 [Enterobacter hormaechei]